MLALLPLYHHCTHCVSCLRKSSLEFAIFAGLALVLLFVVGTKKLAVRCDGGGWPERVRPYRRVSRPSIAQQQSWVDQLQAIGSIEPVQGVRLDAEVAGVVSAINFKNGQDVEAGDVSSATGRHSRASPTACP